MKRRQLNSVAWSLCEYLRSRNNDITGYWGIGILCAVSKKEKRPKFSFKIRPGELIRIYGYELSESKNVAEKLVKHGIDTIEGQLSFFPDGRFSDGVEKFTCGIAIAATQGGRTGLHMCHVECWAHDSSRERRRVQPSDGESFVSRMKRLFKRGFQTKIARMDACSAN